MTPRIRRFALALLLLALPLQGWTTARAVRCPHDMTAAQAPGGNAHDAVASCHEPAAADERPNPQSDSAGDSACQDCAQCQACFANALPTAIRTTSPLSQRSLAFPAPATFAGFIPEHLDPPPLG